VRPVLRPLEIIEVLPARLRAAEGLPIEFDVETFSSEVAFLHRDKVIEAHAFGRNLDRSKACGHGEFLPLCRRRTRGRRACSLDSSNYASEGRFRQTFRHHAHGPRSPAPAVRDYVEGPPFEQCPAEA